MNLTPQIRTEIALNVTRTRVTMVIFNLTIIALMISLLRSRSAAANFVALVHLTVHLTSSLASFIGYEESLHWPAPNPTEYDLEVVRCMN